MNARILLVEEWYLVLCGLLVLFCCAVQIWRDRGYRRRWLIPSLALMVSVIAFFLSWFFYKLLDPFILYPLWTNKILLVLCVLVFTWIPVLLYLIPKKGTLLFLPANWKGRLLTAITFVALIPITFCGFFGFLFNSHYSHYHWTIQVSSPDGVNDIFLFLRQGYIDYNFLLYVRPKGTIFPVIDAHSPDLAPDCSAFSKQDAVRSIRWSDDARIFVVDHRGCFFAYDLVSRRALRSDELQAQHLNNR